MFDPSILHEQAELIARNFSADEINHLGKLIDREYDNHRMAGVGSHFTLSARKAAFTLVDRCVETAKVKQLIQLTAEMHDAYLDGKKVSVDGLEEFLGKLALTGWIYDFRRRRLNNVHKDADDLVNWGSLKDGRVYPITVMSFDIVGNSTLVTRHGARRMEKVYFRLRDFLRETALAHRGRIWSAQGDGGIIAFALRGHEEEAVACALRIQATLPLLALHSRYPIAEGIELRLGIDTGRVKFLEDTGNIVSEVINYAAHLEKYATEPGKVAISSQVAESIGDRYRAMFSVDGEYEGRRYLTVPERLDRVLRREESWKTSRN